MPKLSEEQCLQINNLAIQGVPKKTIAVILNINRSTVYYQLEKMYPRNQSTLGRVSRRPRPKGAYKLTDQIKFNIEQYLIHHKFATNLDIIRDLELEIKDKTTVTRWLEKMGIGSYIAIKKPFLRATNINSRLEYARSVKDWSNEWKSVIFSDEKTFYSNLKTKQRIKRKRGEAFNPDNILSHTQMSNVKINIWGFIAYGIGVKVFMVDDKFDSALYKECLVNNLVPNVDSNRHTVFQQDNCPIHTTPELWSYLRTLPFRILNHPACSPDLNPVENIWNLAQRKLNKYLLTNFISNKASLFSKAKEFCESIPIEMVDSLIESMPKRIREVELNRGLHINY